MIARGRRLSRSERIAGLTESLRKRAGDPLGAGDLKKLYNGDSGQVVGKNFLHSMLEDVPEITITDGKTGPIFRWTGNSK